MKTETSLGLSGLLVIASLLTGCDMKVNFTNSAAQGITEATLAKGYDAVKHDAIDPTTTFSTSDKVVYCVVKLGSVPKGSKVRAEWMTVKCRRRAFRAASHREGDRQCRRSHECRLLFLTAENGLPAGNYRCKIYLNPKKDENNKPDKSLDFTAK